MYYNKYSFRNAMRVWLQKPGAGYVMGYVKWKEFGSALQKNWKHISAVKALYVWSLRKCDGERL